jgi:signal transduction histidine kinase
VTDRELEWRREVNEVMRHDLRTRVGIGQGYVEMLLRHYDVLTPDQRAMAVRGVAESFARLDTFSRRVMLDEKIETGGAVPQPGEVPVARLLEPARGHEAVDVVVRPDVPETVVVDPVLVREVVENLVANAVAAAPPGTRVTVTASCSGAGLLVEVRDEGGTITEADLPVLFQRYGRTGHSRRTRAAGMGLGLSIVRRLVEAHGGTYGVRLGDGTTFWVSLPLG